MSAINPRQPLPDEQALRAKECVEVLLADFRDRLSPDEYERCLMVARDPLGEIGPNLSADTIGAYSRIFGRRT